MEGELRDGLVHVGSAGRERFYDARGYGRPRGDGGLALAPVEAAHLLLRGDLEGVDGMGFRAFFAARRGRFGVRFLVYADLRDRGFYLTPTAVDEDAGAVDFRVYPRGDGPWDETVEHRVRAVGERETVPAAGLAGDVLAVVDEEGEITYLECSATTVEGSTDAPLPSATPAHLLADRVVCWEPPDALHERGFYGQPFAGGLLQLSLVEAASLAARGGLALDELGGDAGDDGGEGDGSETGDGSRDEGAATAGDLPVAVEAGGDRGTVAAVVARGRAVEGERFDRRLRVYAALRDAAVVPKTGFKFGADFRTYADVESVDRLGHSEHLVRVLPADHAFDLRDLALDVRLAGGVRKRMVFALVGESLSWLAVERITP